MRNKNILKALSLIAAVCIAAGCSGSTAETTTAALEQSEPEVDYVDEYGYTYYKNPTIWATEKVFKVLTINGQKFEAPLTLEKLGDGFSYSFDNGSFYDEETRTVCLQLLYNNKPLAWVYLDDCSEIQDTEGKQFSSILFDLSSTSEEYRDDISISGLNIGDDANDIISLIGIPIELSADKEWFSYGDHNDDITLNIIQEDGKVIYIGINLINN